MSQEMSSQNTNYSPINETNSGIPSFKVGEFILPIMKRLWTERKKILFINLIILVFSILILLFIRPYYESSIVIFPDYGNNSSNMSGLATLGSFAGISIGNTSNTLDIYKNLLTSESVAEIVIYGRYRSDNFADSVNLIKYFGITPDNDLSPELQQRKVFIEAYNQLVNSVVKVSLDNNTKFLTLSVRVAEANLSADIANKFIESLDFYVRTKRKSNAAIQRSYIETRMNEVRDSLSVAEKMSEIFQITNKVINQSPALIIEQSRYTRQINILQSVYIQLAQQLELAKIDELRDAPIVNFREMAKNPIVKSGPQRLVILLLVICFSLFITSFFFLFKKNMLKYYKSITNSL